jgi:hypothetical protein
VLGIRRAARKTLGRIRRFNRWWIDRLRPDAPEEPESWPDVPSTPPPEPEPQPAAPVRKSPRPASIRREATPNPDALKFVADRKVVPSGSLSFSYALAAEGHPLGRALFAIVGV